MLNSDELNYLSHPPLYYSINAILGNLLEIEPYKDYQWFRLISLGMVALGLFFYISAAVNLKVAGYGLFIFACSPLIIPNFIYIASSVNNDNLSFLAAACLFYSLSFFHSDRNIRLIFPVVGIYTSIFIIALTKANVALYALALILSWFIFTRFKYFKSFYISKIYLLGLILGILVIAYYAYTFVIFGKFFPYPKYVYEINPVQLSMGYIEYAKIFIVLLFSRFSVAYGHVGYEVYSGILLNSFYFVFIFSGFFYIFYRVFILIKKGKSLVFPLFDAMYVALIALFIAHLVLGYQGYMQTGIVAAVQPRYYLFIFPILWLPVYIYFSKTGFFKIFFYLFTLIVFSLFSVALSAAPRGQMKSLVIDEAKIDFKNTSIDSERHHEVQFPLQNRVSGFVDFVGYRNGSFWIEGWAFDASDSISPIKVHILYDDKPFVLSKVSFARPDVAFALKNLNANFSGFRVKFSDSSVILLPCKISVLAEYPSGLYSLLRDSSCN